MNIHITLMGVNHVKMLNTLVSATEPIYLAQVIYSNGPGLKTRVILMVLIIFGEQTMTG